VQTNITLVVVEVMRRHRLGKEVLVEVVTGLTGMVRTVVLILVAEVEVVDTVQMVHLEMVGRAF
jgi:hypothetical protein